MLSWGNLVYHAVIMFILSFSRLYLLCLLTYKVILLIDDPGYVNGDPYSFFIKSFDVYCH